MLPAFPFCLRLARSGIPVVNTSLPALSCCSIYHFYSLLGNSTTIEGWEKDKVATMVRRGQIQEVSRTPSVVKYIFTLLPCQVKFPYVRSPASVWISPDAIFRIWV